MAAQIVLDFFSWWLIRVPRSIFLSTKIAILAICHLFSLQINLRTLFEPWKNERRKGYEGLARGLGATVRLITIFLNLLIVALTVFLGLIFCLFWYLLPIIVFCPFLV